MKLAIHDNGYVIKLSARDTYDWARKPGASWPCSTLADRRLVAVVDSNGLCDLTIDGKDAPDDIDGNELDAIVSDFTRGTSVAHLWPRWE